METGRKQEDGYPRYSNPFLCISDPVLFLGAGLGLYGFCWSNLFVVLNNINQLLRLIHIAALIDLHAVVTRSNHKTKKN
jgi:hypothetical protein